MRNPLEQALAAPAELVGALRVLPAIAKHTQAMSKHTEELAKITKAMAGLKVDTAAINDLRDEMANVGSATRVLGPMDERMAAIQAAMPVLVEVQQHLALVPDTLTRLESQTVRLSDGLEQMLLALATLAESVDSLQASVKPLGRIARRLPGGSKEEAPSEQ